MMVTFYIAVALLLGYGLLFQFYGSWWNSFPEFRLPTTTPVTRIAVIIPARNEAENILACLQAISTQDYPMHLLQVIVVDDHSTDNTFALASSFTAGQLSVTCLHAPSTANNTAPKKRAIEAGIAVAGAELIVTTDADCIAGPQWLRSIAAFYEESNNVFIAAPVKIQEGKTVLSKFQAIDFLTMQGITAAAIYKRLHNMCNGANLAYTREVFYEVDGFAGVDNIASGDDMLLMQKIVRNYPQGFGYVKSDAAIVTTAPASSWKAFFQQRIRWASKATHYKDRSIFMVLLLVYLCNLIIFSFLLMALWQKTALIYFLLLCVAKFFMELFFVKEVVGFFKQQQLIPWLLFLQPLHIIYIVVSGFLGQFTSYEWKGRKLK